MLEFCGLNDHSQFGEESNNKSSKGESFISPAVRSSFDATSISSLSLYKKHLVAITKSGEILAAGYNGDGQIIGSLAKDDHKKFTKFSIKDVYHTMHPISAVCGFDFTLYIVSQSKTSDIRRLAYSYNNIQTADPLFLNFEGSNPVSLFGGHSTAAAIDADGSIIFIPECSEVENLASSRFERSRLPDGEAATIVAFCGESVYAVSSNGRVFESKTPEEGNSLEFSPVESLNGEKICDMSGTYYHCFAVTENGCVFGHGYNNCGQLGIGKGTDDVSEFVKIPSLKKYKIKHAYAGFNHSLFQTEDGKVLVCGSNHYGELMLEPSKDYVYFPIDSGITDAKYCIAGHYVTAVFIGCDPLESPNRFKAVGLKSCKSSTSSFPDVSGLEIENERLRIDNNIKEQNITKLLNELKVLKEKSDEQELRIKNLENEKAHFLKQIKESDQLHTFRILDDEAIENFEKVEEIEHGSSGKVFKIRKKILCNENNS